MSVNSLTFAARSFRPRQGARCCRTGTRRSEEHTSELQSQSNLVCRLLLEKKKKSEFIVTLPLYVIARANVHIFFFEALVHPRLHCLLFVTFLRSAVETTSLPTQISDSCSG